MLGQDPNRSAKQTEVKQRHPGFTVSNEAAVTPGRTAKPQEIIRSDAIRQLNREGYYVYNTPEKQDVYITIQPETAFFEDEEPRMVRMAGGSFVSGSKRTESFTMPARPEPEPERTEFTQPADMFKHALAREQYEEIDFNTVIIKKNESFEKEVEEPVLVDMPSYKEIYEPAMTEQSFSVGEKGSVAATSSDSAPMPVSAEGMLSAYSEVPEYELEDTPAAEEEAAEAGPVTEVPAGLHVEGNRPTDIAEMDVGATVMRSSFVEMSAGAETAVTESKPMEAEIGTIGLGFTDVPEAVSEMPEANTDESSETVSGPVVIEIADEAEMLTVVVPGLQICDELISEISCESAGTIPDDGLESYDCIFRNVPVRAAALASAPDAPGFTPVKFSFS